MSDDKQSKDERIVGDIKVNLSAGNNELKYYECNGDNCIFEILEDEGEGKEDHSKNKKNSDLVDSEQRGIFNSGRIVVKAIIDFRKQEFLKGVKINLYKINGLSTVLAESKITDENGEVIFSNIEEGSYRIIELINKEYFEKPKYINWNEITIDRDNKKEKILVVNKLKKYRNKHS